MSIQYKPCAVQAHRDTGSPAQVRDVVQALLEQAKAERLPVLVGHITKSRFICVGPKLIEHMVDVVLLF